jgi:hypothetical protein
MKTFDDFTTCLITKTAKDAVTELIVSNHFDTIIGAISNATLEVLFKKLALEDKPLWEKFALILAQNKHVGRLAAISVAPSYITENRLFNVNDIPTDQIKFMCNFDKRFFTEDMMGRLGHPWMILYLRLTSQSVVAIIREYVKLFTVGELNAYIYDGKTVLENTEQNAQFSILLDKGVTNADLGKLHKNISQENRERLKQMQQSKKMTIEEALIDTLGEEFGKMVFSTISKKI